MISEQSRVSREVWRMSAGGVDYIVMGGGMAGWAVGRCFRSHVYHNLLEL